MLILLLEYKKQLNILIKILGIFVRKLDKQILRVLGIKGHGIILKTHINLWKHQKLKLLLRPLRLQQKVLVK
jgi:hypothetical protein